MQASRKLDKPADDPDRLLAARLAIVFGQGRLAILISPLISVFAAYAMWPVARHGLLIGWVLSLMGFSVLRTLLADAYHRQSGETLDVRRWERLFVLSLVGTCLAWGVGGLLVMLDVPAHIHAVLYFFLIVTAAGAITSYGAHAPSGLIVLSVILGPSTLYMFAIGDRLHVAMGLAALFFAVVALRGIRLVSHAFGNSLLLADELEMLSRTDVLSGLYNRRAFTELGQQALAHASRARRTCALVILDVDDFKSINDRRGHAAGDLAIRELGRMLLSTVRKGEHAARIGGEEFAVILPDTTAEQANQLADRILESVRALRPALDGETFGFTASLGVAVNDGGRPDFEDLLAAADRALYQAKNAGRDRVTKA